MGSTTMSERRPVTLEFLAEQQHRVLSELRILRDDVDVLTASTRRIDNSYDRLDRRMEMLLTEMREMRAEIRAMQAQHDRTAARVRALEERS
jgi:chromosome segregation ATPase